jgi:hypothetical protein
MLHPQENPSGNDWMLKITFPIDQRVLAACQTPEKLSLEYQLGVLKHHPLFDDEELRMKYAIKAVRSLLYETIDHMLFDSGVRIDNTADEYYARFHGLLSKEERADWERHTGLRAIDY